jgi:hypothetical protein
MSNDQNGWNEWSRHVLKELERLNDNYEKISGDVQELKGRMIGYHPEELTKLKVKVNVLESKDVDQEKRLRELETTGATFSGKWAVISIVASLIAAALVSMAFKWIAPDPPESGDKKTSSIIEMNLSPAQLEELKQGSLRTVAS